MTPANLAGQFGDTTYTKVFVGGLAWETQRETMRKYFDQFGEILEAVVITDKNTGRSKGYGFVTFREPEAAMRACVDAAPVIDGRRANCNLASLGAQKTRPPTPQNGGRNNRGISTFQRGVGTAFHSPATFPHYAIQQGIPYNLYGYSPYSPDYAYPTSYYNAYGGGAAAQYPMYGGAPGMVAGTTAYYPYYQFGQGYSVQYPHAFQYSPMNSNGGIAVAAFPTQYYGASTMSHAPPPPPQPGMTMALATSTLHPPAPHHYRVIPHFAPSTPSEQPSG